METIILVILCSLCAVPLAYIFVCAWLNRPASEPEPDWRTDAARTELRFHVRMYINRVTEIIEQFRDTDGYEDLIDQLDSVQSYVRWTDDWQYDQTMFTINILQALYDALPDSPLTEHASLKKLLIQADYLEGLLRCE